MTRLLIIITITSSLVMWSCWCIRIIVITPSEEQSWCRLHWMNPFTKANSAFISVFTGISPSSPRNFSFTRLVFSSILTTWLEGQKSGISKSQSSKICLFFWKSKGLLCDLSSKIQLSLAQFVFPTESGNIITDVEWIQSNNPSDSAKFVKADIASI